MLAVIPLLCEKAIKKPQINWSYSTYSKLTLKLLKISDFVIDRKKLLSNNKNICLCHRQTKLTKLFENNNQPKIRFSENICLCPGHIKLTKLMQHTDQTKS